uniref:Bm1329, isoform d n=1 Tax=Brugia malayi TaxID=6279 RepID=A0A1I9G2F3_BRUMA|nr:Bm1329, isoform d [Brugia malayi]
MVNKVYLPGSRATTAAGNCDEGDLTTLQRKEERLTPLPDITNLTLFGGPPPTNSLIECEHQVAWKTKAVITRRTCPPLSPYPVEQISSPDWRNTALHSCMGGERRTNEHKRCILLLFYTYLKRFYFCAYMHACMLMAKVTRLAAWRVTEMIAAGWKI